MAGRGLVAAPLGGYENEFVDDIDSLSCSVCLLPFRDPHLVSCCGAKFCEPCIGRVKEASKPCPLCKQEFVSLLDRSFQRKVLELNVRCSRRKDGCQWVGELRHVVHHEREECEWAMIECSYQCGAHLSRRLMAEHQRDKCQQRPLVKLEARLEGFMKTIEEQNMENIEEKLTTESKRLEIEFETKLVCERKRHQSEICKMEERHKKEMAIVRDELKKMKGEYATKMADIETTHAQKLENSMSRVKDLEETVQLMKGIFISSNRVPSGIEFIMTQYSSNSRFHSDWYSPPFYSGPGGYKMCLRICANAVSAVSVYVHLMRGEYDSMLKWPFRGEVTIQLVNHKSNIYHHEVTVCFGVAASAIGAANRVTTRDGIAKIAWGSNQFISHAQLYSQTETSLFIDQNDFLTFRVTKIVVHGL